MRQDCGLSRNRTDCAVVEAGCRLAKSVLKGIKLSLSEYALRLTSRDLRILVGLLTCHADLSYRHLPCWLGYLPTWSGDFSLFKTQQHGWPSESVARNIPLTCWPLASLHWLRVPERILFKVAVLTYCAVNGSAPWVPGILLRPGRQRAIQIAASII